MQKQHTQRLISVDIHQYQLEESQKLQDKRDEILVHVLFHLIHLEIYLKLHQEQLEEILKELVADGNGHMVAWLIRHFQEEAEIFNGKYIRQ